MRVSHRDSAEDLVRKGRNLEQIGLGRAVDPPAAGRPAHLRNRIVVYGNKTVVFD